MSIHKQKKERKKSSPESRSRRRKGIRLKDTLLKKVQSSDNEFSAFLSICQAVSGSLNLEEMLHSAAKEIIRVLGVDSIGIYFIRENERNLELIYSKGYSDKFYQSPIITRDIGDGILGRVAERGTPIIYEDISQFESPYLEIFEREGLKSAAYIPLLAKDRTLGVMRVSSHSSHVFSLDDITLLTAIGRQMGMGIENSRLHQQCKIVSYDLEQKMDELQHSYQELEHSEENYRTLFDANPNPTFIIDRDTLKILDVNSRAQDNYHFTREEFLGMYFINLSFREDKELLYGLKSILDNQSIFYSKKRHQTKESVPFYVNINVCHTRHMGKDILIAAVTDITTTVETEAQLIQAGKMASVGTMAPGIAHELNQPLSVIKAGADFFLKMIRRGEKIYDEEFQTITEEINTQVDRAAEIIRHLRSFARPGEAISTKVDINSPIKDVFKILGQQLMIHQIEIQLELDEDLPPIMADHNRLEQVFVNLVGNAMDAIEEKPHNPDQPGRRLITIKSYGANGKVLVKVSDTGAGIPRDLMDKIFEPFFTTKEVGKGTGLGLCISYGIVKDYGGLISVRSDPGEGTTFELSFPAVQE